MTSSNNFQLSIHLTLKKLIEEKSKRDNTKFTACQLAQEIGIPRSIITKLTHPDKNKRVSNPRIDTLIKIVEFFKKDGFQITLDDVLGINTKTYVKNQLLPKNRLITVPIYLLDDFNKKIGQVDLKISNKYKNVIGFCSNTDIKPFFKAGSIFIIDPQATLEEDMLVAINLLPNHKIEIKKYCTTKNKLVFKSLDGQTDDIIIMPTSSIRIIGVVVQVNANT